MVLCRGQRIELDCLPTDILHASPSGDENLPEPTNPLGEAEAEAIFEALRQHNGHRGNTAAALGIDKSTLWRKMKRFFHSFPRLARAAEKHAIMHFIPAIYCNIAAHTFQQVTFHAIGINAYVLLRQILYESMPASCKEWHNYCIPISVAENV